MITKINLFKENILVPRNLDSRKDKLKQQAIKLLGQETIDGDFSLEKWMLDIPEELIKVKTINGSFDCTYLDLIELPKWFERLIINKSFNCSDNELTTLKGCPKTINSDFICCYNKLITLEGCSETINGDFICHNNRLTTLENGPKIVKGDFNCYKNNAILQQPNDCKIKGKFIN